MAKAERVVVMGSFERAAFERIRDRFESGEDVPLCAVRAAQEVLGCTFVRRGKGQRPDAADRAANDRSVGEMVVL